MSEEAATAEGGAGAVTPPAEAKKKGAFGRVLLYGVLFAATASAGWFVNDRSAESLVKEHRESTTKSRKILIRIANEIAFMPQHERQANLNGHVARQRKKLQTVIDAGGGKGPVHFLTRGEVKKAARRNHLTAALLKPIFTLLEVLGPGDITNERTKKIRQARKEIAAYEGVEAEGITLPNGVTDLIESVRQLLNAPQQLHLSQEISNRVLLHLHTK